MELKEFIKTTMQSIIDASSELIEQNSDGSALINPLQRSAEDRNVVMFADGFVPITMVSFDVAITKGSEKAGGGGASVDVYFAKVGADGEVKASNENVSKVQFSLRAALPATSSPPRNQRFDGSTMKDV